MRKTTDSGNRRKISLIETVGSVLSAALGIQTENNRRRDFEGGSPKLFLIVGLLLTLIFIGSIMLLVKLVLYGF